MIAADRQGNQLIALHTCGPEALAGFAPLTHSLVLGCRDGAVLFVFNNWRQCWELPGGVIEEGESAEACARRELQEETGQTPARLKLIGAIEWRLGKAQRLEYGALFQADLSADAQTIDTEEIGATRFWNLQDEIGPVALLDVCLAKLIMAKPCRTRQ
jgi:8-oxo-dGTP pyrophosphatase MutT (NUDIX family)